MPQCIDGEARKPAVFIISTLTCLLENIFWRKIEYYDFVTTLLLWEIKLKPLHSVKTSFNRNRTFLKRRVFVNIKNMLTC